MIMSHSRCHHPAYVGRCPLQQSQKAQHQSVMANGCRSQPCDMLIGPIIVYISIHYTLSNLYRVYMMWFGLAEYTSDQPVSCTIGVWPAGVHDHDQDDVIVTAAEFCNSQSHIMRINCLNIARSQGS